MKHTYSTDRQTDRQTVLTWDGLGVGVCGRRRLQQAGDPVLAAGAGGSQTAAAPRHQPVQLRQLPADLAGLGRSFSGDLSSDLCRDVTDRRTRPGQLLTRRRLNDRSWGRNGVLIEPIKVSSHPNRIITADREQLDRKDYIGEDNMQVKTSQQSSTVFCRRVAESRFIPAI